MHTTVTPDQLTQLWRVSGHDGRAAQLQMAPMPRAIQRPQRPGKPRVGAVLVLLYPDNDGIYVALTRRPDSLKDHSGQISFPGGKVEDGEGAADAALRETWEELGVASDEIDVLGELTSLYIPPTDFEVHPFVGWSAFRPNFTPNPDEVAELIEVSIPYLLHPDHARKEPWQFGTYTLDVPYYDVWGHKVWGATAMMLSEFLSRWRLAFGSG